MARRKTSDDGFVWLLVLGGIGYGIYAWLNSSGASAQTTPKTTSQPTNPLLQGSATYQPNVPSVNIPGNQSNVAAPGQ